jgi:hypothetical protein
MLQKIKRKKQASKMLGENDFPGFSWPSVTEERICKVQNNNGALEENNFEQDRSPQTTINPKQMQQPIDYSPSCTIPSPPGSCNLQVNKGIPTRSSALRVQWWLNLNHMPFLTL